MGLCGSSESNMTPEERERAKNERIRSKELERQAQSDHMAEAQINKLLLLGAGESGKSTLFKQMISIYGTGFPESERKTFELIIYNNIITSMQTLLTAVPNFGGEGVIGDPSYKPGEVACADSLAYVKDMAQDAPIELSNVHHFKALWADKAVQTAFENRSNFQLTDSAQYFFDKIEDIGQEDYLPTEQDVLRSRVRTTGIVENNFEIDSNQFKMFDVGGQRNERKKWIHCFENVTAVLFVGVLSEYDLVLYEDESMNRMEETLNLFEEICNSRWFRETSIILFLNKMDMFEEKIQKVPLTVCPVFADYTGPNEFQAGCDLIQQTFIRKNRNPEKVIYAHVTCATDTKNVSMVFNAVKDIIIRKSLGEAGLV
jgi:GTPase SAR1 family protein